MQFNSFQYGNKTIRYKQHFLTKPTLQIIKLKIFIRIAFPLPNRKIKQYNLCCRKQNNDASTVYFKLPNSQTIETDKKRQCNITALAE